jgi:PncC family amidohydrolase
VSVSDPLAALHAQAQQVLVFLKRNHLTLSFAESCTGGLLAGLITSVAGSSESFLGGAITYANEAKINVLGVKPETLQAYGAVSAEAAAEMALGAKDIFHSSIACSTTGIAGPGGGSIEKPVGTVHYAIAYGSTVRQGKMLFTGDREAIRWQTVQHVLTELMQMLQENMK